MMQELTENLFNYTELSNVKVIIMRIKWESNWGKPIDESESQKRRSHTFESLRKDIREHHPILKRIRDQEREVENLAKDFIAKETGVPEEGNRLLREPTLESLHNEICEE